MSKLSIIGELLYAKKEVCPRKNIQNTISSYGNLDGAVRLREISRLRQLGEQQHNCRDCHQEAESCRWSCIFTDLLDVDLHLSKGKSPQQHPKSLPPSLSAGKQFVPRNGWSLGNTLYLKFRESLKKCKNNLSLNRLGRKDSVVWILKPNKHFRISRTNIFSPPDTNPMRQQTNSRWTAPTKAASQPASLSVKATPRHTKDINIARRKQTFMRLYDTEHLSTATNYHVVKENRSSSYTWHSPKSNASKQANHCSTIERVRPQRPLMRNNSKLRTCSNVSSAVSKTSMLAEFNESHARLHDFDNVVEPENWEVCRRIISRDPLPGILVRKPARINVKRIMNEERQSFADPHQQQQKRQQLSFHNNGLGNSVRSGTKLVRSNSGVKPRKCPRRKFATGRKKPEGVGKEAKKGREIKAQRTHRPPTSIHKEIDIDSLCVSSTNLSTGRLTNESFLNLLRQSNVEHEWDIERKHHLTVLGQISQESLRRQHRYSKRNRQMSAQLEYDNYQRPLCTTMSNLNYTISFHAPVSLHGIHPPGSRSKFHS